MYEAVKLLHVLYTAQRGVAKEAVREGGGGQGKKGHVEHAKGKSGGQSRAASSIAYKEASSQYGEREIE